MQSPLVGTLVLPKINSAEDLHHVSDAIHSATRLSPSRVDAAPLKIVSSVESARALWDLGKIASWKSQHGEALGGVLSALLVRENFKPFSGQGVYG